MAVGFIVKRALQAAAMLGIVVLAGLIWRRSLDDSFVQACVFGVIALGVLGLSLSEFGGSSAASPRESSGASAADRAFDQAERRFAADMATIVRLLKGHLSANSRYSDSLSRANDTLPQLDKPEQIRAVVISLIEENQKIQTKVDDLSRTLDDSVAKIDKLRANLAEATDKALRDPLTGLGNRRFFDQKLKAALRETPAADGLCLAICDLDWFKAINDKFGHPVGDMVLKMFGETLTDVVGEGDVVARIGGEEFAIVFPGARSAQAASLADQVRRRLEAKKWAVGSSGAVVGTVTASFGVAERRDDEGAEDLIRRADQALYRAKANGRNRVVVD